MAAAGAAATGRLDASCGSASGRGRAMVVAGWHPGRDGVVVRGAVRALETSRGSERSAEAEAQQQLAGAWQRLAKVGEEALLIKGSSARISS
ncbi:hypothetical protein ZWY2020_049975 [Hordeum vulgare]|nr:hypothetical protein ZWY2020_049975 [Hordeum vulgare]